MVKLSYYETILPMWRQQNYEMLTHVNIDDDRMTAIAKANNIKGLAVYTDGSGCGENIGVAVILMANRVELKKLQYRLGTEKQHTVYEVEMLAVILVLHLLTQVAHPITRVTFGLNNQAVLLGLQNK